MADSTGLAVVTGSSSGIGRETARAFAVRGYRTVLIARRLDLLEELAADLGRYAPSVPLALDLSAEEAVESELSRVAEQAGSVDVLVNCAGHGMYRPFLEDCSDDHHQLMRVHYFGAAAAMRAVLPAMLARGRGHIVNVGSMSTKMGPWGHGGYAAAKAALTALTESLSAEYGPSGVRFSVVHPGIVDTPYYRGPSLAPLRQRTKVADRARPGGPCRGAARRAAAS
jgi:NAD(P)-dependent dehydrogenase (short-subunit alcohol dehydrogenase family)